MIRGFASYHVNVAITMPACAFIYSVTDSRLSYVQQSTLYCIYVMQTMLSRVLFGVLRTSRAQLGKYRGCLGFLSGASSRLTGTYEPHQTYTRAMSVLRVVRQLTAPSSRALSLRSSLISSRARVPTFSSFSAASRASFSVSARRFGEGTSAC